MIWVKKRLAERSTYVGLAILLNAAGVAVGTESVGAVCSGLLSLIGIYEAARAEK